MEKTIYFDITRCGGCGACISACMDQNDLYPEKGQIPFRHVYQIDDGEYPTAIINYISIACQHCEDAPCSVACPTGAISKDLKTNAVVVNRDLCIGCRSCALACPFGVPRYDKQDKMQKCNLCSERVEAGLLPACVKVCPTRALQYGPINKIQENKQFKYVVNITQYINRNIRD